MRTVFVGSDINGTCFLAAPSLPAFTRRERLIKDITNVPDDVTDAEVLDRYRATAIWSDRNEFDFTDLHGGILLDVPPRKAEARS